MHQRRELLGSGPKPIAPAFDAEHTEMSYGPSGGAQVARLNPLE